MSGSAIAPRNSGPVRTQRFVPPLPAGIPILPGQEGAGLTTKLPGGVIVLAIVVLVALLVVSVNLAHRWLPRDSGEDAMTIENVMDSAMYEHPGKGARIPITLSNGPRILEIDSAVVRYFPPPQVPQTCISLTVLDPSTGAKDPNYPDGNLTCLVGVHTIQ
jgi:hypothetical protein